MQANTQLCFDTNNADFLRVVSKNTSSPAETRDRFRKQILGYTDCSQIKYQNEYNVLGYIQS